MAYRFDHVIIAVRDLDEAAHVYSELGFNVEPGGRHTGMGTHNAIVQFPTGYLELLSVYNEGEALDRPRPRALVEYLRAHSGGLIGYVLSSDDVEKDAVRLRAAGIEFDGPTHSERLTPDGRRLGFTTVRSAGRPYPSNLPVLVHADSPATGLETTHTNSVNAVAAISIAVADLNMAADLYVRYLGVSPSEFGDDPDLVAKWTRLRLGKFAINLLAPYDEGTTRRALGVFGEGPIQLTLTATDEKKMEAALDISRPNAHGIVTDVLGTRIRFLSDPAAV